MLVLIAVVVSDVVKETVGDLLLPNCCDYFFAVGYSYF